MQLKFRKNEMFLFEEISINDNKCIDQTIIEHFNKINEQKRMIKRMSLNYPNVSFKTNNEIKRFKDVLSFEDIPNFVIDMIETEIISSNITSKKILVKCAITFDN
jgi:hypothetical protein